MSEPDKYDEQAAELLPCCWVQLGEDELDPQEPCPPKHPGCAACEKRPAVAARLRAVYQEGFEDGRKSIKLGLEIERLQMEVASLKSPQPGPEQNYYFMLQGAKQELTKLKAQLAGLHGKIMNLPVPPQLVSSVNEYYLAGHRDARHAAAELCAIKQEER